MSVSRLILCGRRKRQRLQQGPLGTYMDRLATDYMEQGYGREYSVASLKAIDRFGRWLKRDGFKPCDVDEQRIERYLQRCSVRLRHCSRAALPKLLGLLREIGVCPPLAPVVKGPIQILEDEFTQYLVRERGLAARTVEHYGESARAFLTACPNAQERLGALTAADVLRFIQHRAEVREPVHVQQLCTGLRAFLRYLQFRGKTQTDLARSVPRIARWRLTTLPKFLSRAQVQQVLRHCDRKTAVGRRDYAVLMLLARLGLRAEEIRLLTLDDIDWRSGGPGPHVRCCGKGRKERCTPLTKPIVVLFKAWLKELTQRDTQVLFPNRYGGRLSADSVQHLVRKYVRAAAGQCPSLKSKRVSPHVLRHSAAMELLAADVDSSIIALWLGHESVNTTQIYLHAHLALKEAALAKTTPHPVKPTRFQPGDRLLQFLSAL